MEAMAGRRTLKAMLALVVVGLLCVPAMSAAAVTPEQEGHAAAEEHSESNLFAGDLGNAVWTLVIFLLAVFVLGKFAWGPLLSTLQDRESFIRESLAQAKSDREEAEARLAEYTSKLEEARAEATAIVEEGRRDAEVVHGKIEEEARAEAERMIDRAKREIEAAKTTAIRELYDKSASFATDVAARIIKREVSAADHERVIADAIERVDRQDLN
jgi:F-type H+-transporting ATPase subunit b